MKKYLFLFFAFIALSVSAKDTEASTLDVTVKDNSIITVSLNNGDKLTNIQLDYKATGDIKVSAAKRGTVVKGRDDDDEYIFTFISKLDIEKPFTSIYSLSNPEIQSGELVVLTCTLSGTTGELIIQGIGGDIKSEESLFLAPVVITLKDGQITGISNASANADEASVKAQKFMTKKGLVIAKGDKKYNAAAQEVK